MTTLSKYRKYWEDRERLEKTALEKRRKDAVRTAAELTDVLVKEFGVKKVVLFGSALTKGGFRKDSDIDLGVEGLPKESYFEAVARLMMASRFDVDLKPIEDVSDLLKKRMTGGRVLYEQRKDP
jgi:predicted nucleotidyltransferase